MGWGGFYLGPSHRVAAAFSARGCPHGKKLCTAHYFSTGIRNLRLSKNFLPFGWPGRPGRVAVAAPKPFKTGKLRGRPPKDPAKKAAEAEQKRRDAHKKATIDFDKVYDDRKRYLDAGIGDEFAGWRADIERLPDRFARPFQSRPRGASRPVRLGLPGRFGVRTGCQFPQVCPPPCRSATSGAPGTNLGYLTDPRYYAARTAYFRCGKFCSRLRCFSVFRPRSAGVSARRSARVCLGRRSLGRNFFPA